jgi:hypothetical protein
MAFSRQEERRDRPLDGDRHSSGRSEYALALDVGCQVKAVGGDLSAFVEKAVSRQPRFSDVFVSS